MTKVDNSDAAISAGHRAKEALHPLALEIIALIGDGRVARSDAQEMRADASAVVEAVLDALGEPSPSQVAIREALSHARKGFVERVRDELNFSLQRCAGLAVAGGGSQSERQVNLGRAMSHLEGQVALASTLLTAEEFRHVVDEVGLSLYV